MNNTDISTSNKDKTPASINNIKTFTKEQLAIEIQRLSTINIQFINNKIKTEKIKANLKANKMQLFNKKNSLIVKRKELRAEIVVLNVVKSFNIPIYGYQDLLLNQGRDKFKAKGLFSFDNIKKNFQRFFIRI